MTPKLLPLSQTGEAMEMFFAGNVTVNELTHEKKLEDTIKILQQQMAEGNDHIEYELKMRQKEKTNRSLRYATLSNF